jgi:hypothetical protein
MNVTAFGFHRDRKWMFSGSEDGTIKIWDPRCAWRAARLPRSGHLTVARGRTSGYQRDYQSKAPINTVVLHPNQVNLLSAPVRAGAGLAAHRPPQAELISGDEDGHMYVWDLTANQCKYDVVRGLPLAPRAIAWLGGSQSARVKCRYRTRTARCLSAPLPSPRTLPWSSRPTVAGAPRLCGPPQHRPRLNGRHAAWCTRGGWTAIPLCRCRKSRPTGRTSSSVCSLPTPSQRASSCALRIAYQSVQVPCHHVCGQDHQAVESRSGGRRIQARPHAQCAFGLPPPSPHAHRASHTCAAAHAGSQALGVGLRLLGRLSIPRHRCE